MDLDGDPDIVLNGFWFETPEDLEPQNFKKHVFDKNRNTRYEMVEQHGLLVAESARRAW